MKKIILFISCVFCFGVASAQVPSFEWAKQIGNIYEDISLSIALDKSGNVYTTGSFAGTVDFDPGSGVFNISSVAGTADIFISKLDAYGNFIWAKKLGGSASTEFGHSIAVDSLNNVYTTGIFFGTADFDPGPGTFNLTDSAGSGASVFISKLDSLGNFVWAKNINATSYIGGNSIALDEFGNVYFTGNFDGTADFNPGSGVFNLTSFGTSDMFISKLDSLGNFVWAKNVGSAAGMLAYYIAIDALGNIYTTGSFFGITDFDSGAGIFNLIPLGDQDVFISKLDSLGNFVWAKNFGGGISNDCGYGIAIDELGNVYTTGQYSVTADFDPGLGTFNLTSSGAIDVFISKLDSSGNFIWAKGLGGSTNDLSSSVVLDAFGNVYTSGYFTGTCDFDPGAGTFNLTSPGSDIFISKIDLSGNFIWAQNMGGSGSNGGVSLSLDAENNIHLTGYLSGAADMDPGSGIFYLTSSSSNDDGFVLKLSQPPTDINETTNPNNISIYPNPNSGTFNISISPQIKNAIIEVYNSIGQLVYQQEIVNQENSIELLNHANGLYFVKVMSENKIVGTGKIIKE